MNGRLEGQVALVTGGGSIDRHDDPVAAEANMVRSVALRRSRPPAPPPT